VRASKRSEAYVTPPSQEGPPMQSRPRCRT